MRYARALVDGIARVGSSRSGFLAAANWERKRLDATEARIPASEFHRLCEVALDHTGNPALGLHVLRVVIPDSIDLVAQLVLQATTVRDALQAQLRLHKLMADTPSIEVIEGERHVAIRHTGPSAASVRVRRFFAEMHMVGLCQLFRYFARGARPVAVSFEHAAPEYSAEYLRVFGDAVRFGQPTTKLVFERDLMDATRRYRDRELHRALCTLADRRVSQLERRASCTQAVRDLIEQRARGEVDTVAVARALGVSTRSLRRQLAAEGTSFEALSSEVLTERAKHMLAVQNKTIQETAYEMGYSTATSFHRAFKRWTGTTPSAWQAARAKQA